MRGDNLIGNDLGMYKIMKYYIITHEMKIQKNKTNL